MKNDAMQRRARGVKLSSIIFCVTVLVAWLPAVTLTPNANSSPVAWLLQSNVVINGTVNRSGAVGAWCSRSLDVEGATLIPT
jgi:hypothetical protein